MANMTLLGDRLGIPAILQEALLLLVLPGGCRADRSTDTCFLFIFGCGARFGASQ